MGRRRVSREQSQRLSTPSETNQLILELREEIRATRPDAAPARTLGEMAGRFLAVKLQTIASAPDFKGRMNNHVLRAFGDATWKTLKKRDVQAFLLDLIQQRGLSRQTANHVRDVGRQLVEDAIDNEEWPTSNPFARTDPFRLDEPEKDILTRREASALLRAVPSRWRPIFALALYLGPRRKSIYSLLVADVDLVHGLIDFNDTKTKKKLKMVPIPRELTPHLRHAIATTPGPWLFVNRYGNRHSRESRALNRVLRAAFVKAGIVRNDGRIPKITFRGLRRCCSCLLQDAGAHPWVVSKVLGHSQASLAAMGNPVENMTARRYTVFQPGFVRRQLNKLTLKKR